MLFEENKLASDSVEDLLRCPIHSVKPYALMLAPVYVFMKLNHKLVYVKAPLDFFTPDELTRLTRYETFFLPQFVKVSARFQTAARITRNILMSAGAKGYAPAPFEISKEVHHVLYPLWGKNEKIEPFFMTIFSDELCGPLEPALLEEARENAIVLHNLGLILSGSFVFLSLHVKSFTHFEISKLRTEIYVRTVRGETWDRPQSEDEVMIQKLYQLVQISREVNCNLLLETAQEWGQKISARLKLYSTTKNVNSEPSPSIFGPEGFAA